MFTALSSEHSWLQLALRTSNRVGEMQRGRQGNREGHTDNREIQRPTGALIERQKATQRTDETLYVCGLIYVLLR
jgi:hypothetical protein